MMIVIVFLCSDVLPLDDVRYMRMRVITKTTTLVGACFLAAYGVFSLKVSHFALRLLRQQRKAQPFSIEVDLSQPNEFSRQLSLTRPIKDRFALQLVLPSSLTGKAEPHELLAGLVAGYSIIDSNGVEQLSHSNIRELLVPRVELTSGRPKQLRTICGMTGKNNIHSRRPLVIGTCPVLLLSAYSHGKEHGSAFNRQGEVFYENA